MHGSARTWTDFVFRYIIALLRKNRPVAVVRLGRRRRVVEETSNLHPYPTPARHVCTSTVLVIYVRTHHVYTYRHATGLRTRGRNRFFFYIHVGQRRDGWKNRNRQTVMFVSCDPDWSGYHVEKSSSLRPVFGPVSAKRPTTIVRSAVRGRPIAHQYLEMWIRRRPDIKMPPRQINDYLYTRKKF